MHTVSNLNESAFSSWVLVFVRVILLAQYFVSVLDVPVRRRLGYIEDFVEICRECEC